MKKPEELIDIPGLKNLALKEPGKFQDLLIKILDIAEEVNTHPLVDVGLELLEKVVIKWKEKRLSKGK